MKAITILQPWASLIACGAKQIETRGWKTTYRGPIAIHAAKSCKACHMNFAFQEPFYSALRNQTGCMLDQGPEGSGKRILYPLPGSIIAIAELVDCLEIIDDYGTLENGQVVTGNELAFGDYSQGRIAWKLSNVKAIKPIPARGQQRIWNWAGEMEEGGIDDDQCQPCHNALQCLVWAREGKVAKCINADYFKKHYASGEKIIIGAELLDGEGGADSE